MSDRRELGEHDAFDDPLVDPDLLSEEFLDDDSFGAAAAHTSDHFLPLDDDHHAADPAHAGGGGHANDRHELALRPPSLGKGEELSFYCRQCSACLFTGDETPAHRTEMICPTCLKTARNIKHAKKFFCSVCLGFAKKDKFIRDHERVQDDGRTRCFPGRVADRTRKWTDAQSNRIVKFNPVSDDDFECLLEELKERWGASDGLTLEQLRRKAEYIRSVERKRPGGGGGSSSCASGTSDIDEDDEDDEFTQDSDDELARPAPAPRRLRAPP